MRLTKKAAGPGVIGKPLGGFGYRGNSLYLAYPELLGNRATGLRSSSIAIRVGLTGHTRWGPSLRTIHPVGNLIGLSLARSMKTVSRSFVLSSMKENGRDGAVVPRSKRIGTSWLGFRAHGGEFAPGSSRRRLWIAPETGREPVPVSYRKRMESAGTGCEPAASDALKLLAKNSTPFPRRIRRVNREDARAADKGTLSPDSPL
jgi:hypothetical protein